MDRGGGQAFGLVRPNHILLNEYLPGQGISPHLDGDLFYPTIATVSLGTFPALENTLLALLEDHRLFSTTGLIHLRATWHGAVITAVRVSA